VRGDVVVTDPALSANGPRIGDATTVRRADAPQVDRSFADESH
jgi:hypothetical protein